MATLAELARRYLAQPLPDISGIFQPRADTPVEEDTVEETVPGITPQLLQPVSGGGGGDSFSVYNPDPTRTRTIKDYRFPFKFTGEDLPEAGDYISPPTGIRSLLSKLIPGQQIVKGIEGILGPNRRAILENQLLGGGFALDDIGRIVATDYNTPEGIMAGYNAAKITDKTFDKRRQRVAKTLKEKYGMTDEEIEAAIAGEYEGDVPIDPFTGKPTTLINKLDLFNQSQNLFNKRKNIADIITQDKITKRNEDRDRDRGVDVKKNIETIKKIDFSGMNIGGGGGRDRDDGPRNISTSGGNIGDRVSSSYREDPDTGLL